MKQRGFTVIELLVVIVLLLTLGVLFWIQKNNIETATRDDKRRTAINAMYYDLEEVYYPKHKSYPKTIDENVLTAMDKGLLTDPSGVKIGDAMSDYRYEPVNCNGDECGGYTLRSALENEADFVKTSRH
jgi:prepilin-type N-terminal cleavage/methylation domain-containing protein